MAATRPLPMLPIITPIPRVATINTEKRTLRRMAQPNISPICLPIRFFLPGRRRPIARAGRIIAPAPVAPCIRRGRPGHVSITPAGDSVYVVRWLERERGSEMYFDGDRSLRSFEAASGKVFGAGTDCLKLGGIATMLGRR